jgi:hypothetical protein
MQCSQEILDQLLTYCSRGTADTIFAFGRYLGFGEDSPHIVNPHWDNLRIFDMRNDHPVLKNLSQEELERFVEMVRRILEQPENGYVTTVLTYNVREASDPPKWTMKNAPIISIDWGDCSSASHAARTFAMMQKYRREKYGVNNVVGIAKVYEKICTTLQEFAATHTTTKYNISNFSKEFEGVAEYEPQKVVDLLTAAGFTVKHSGNYFDGSVVYTDLLEISWAVPDSEVK